MNALQTELFHQAVLRVLDANGSRFGLGLPAIALLVNEHGFSPKQPEVEKELDYLEGKGLVRPVEKRVNPANRAWKITSEGTDYLRERGL